MKKKMNLSYITKKIVILVIFILCFILAACVNGEKSGNGEQGSWDFDAESSRAFKEGKYFLLLNDNGTISINTYKNSEIIELQTFIISESSLFATDQEERVAIVHADKNIVIIYEFQTSEEIEVYVPFKIWPKSILLNGDNLFVGGIMYEGVYEIMLAQYHIQSGEWFRLEIPEHLARWGKAVDDLVVSDSFLIAIDNIVLPKYILFYHLNSTCKLELSHYKQVPSNGGWETIRQGWITLDYLGLLSETFGGWGGGTFEHITIYNNLDLTSSFTISIASERFPLEAMNQIDEIGWPDFYTINDFLIFGDKVLFAHRTKGLGAFKIDDSYFEFNNENPYSRRNARVDADKIKYIPFENEEIIRLTLIPNEPKIVLTLRNTLGRIKHEIFCLLQGMTK